MPLAACGEGETLRAVGSLSAEGASGITEEARGSR